MSMVGRCPACRAVDLVDDDLCMLPHVGAGNCRDACYATGLLALSPRASRHPLFRWWDDLAGQHWPRRLDA